jgi:CHAT domain-containing protein/Tfp pilus assembly protein PilF
MRAIAFGLLLAASTWICAQNPAPPKLTPEQEKKLKEIIQASDDAADLYQRGKPLEAIAKLEGPFAELQTLFPEKDYPNGHKELAMTLSNLGSFYQAVGNFEKALSYHDRSLAMRRKLYAAEATLDNSRGLALTLNNLASFHMAVRRFERGVALMEEALLLRRKQYPKETHPNGHSALALVLNNLGVMCHEMGDYAKAQEFYDESLSMRVALFPKSQFPQGHIDLLGSLMSIGLNHSRAGNFAKGLDFLDQALAMSEAMFSKKEFPNGHPYIAFVHQYLASTHGNMGQFDRAIAASERALAMRNALYPVEKYPKGHIDIARALNNIGTYLLTSGQPEKALTHFEQSLAMNRKLFPEAKFPDGNPEIAAPLMNIGRAYVAIGDLKQSLSFHQQSLAMKRRLYSAEAYPLGHPEIVESLTGVGVSLDLSGKPNEALAVTNEALTMSKRLYPADRYPAGHATTTYAIQCAGQQHARVGDVPAAAADFQKAIAMWHAMMQRELPTATEATAFQMIRAEFQARDLYLSLSLPAENSESIYRDLWPTRASVTRMLEQRHAAARTAGTEHAVMLERLRVIRRRTDQLLQDQRIAAADRDRLLSELTEEGERLERQLAVAIPALKRRLGGSESTLDALRSKLPKGSALIDFVGYRRYSGDVAGYIRPIVNYVAFVVVPNQPVARIEFGPAAPINALIHSWRKAIDLGQGSKEAQNLHQMIWTPIAKHLPTDTKAVYLSPDMDLARIPWAAIEDGKGRVLLEDYAMVTVPHGSFVLEQLQSAKRVPESNVVLTVGDIDYGKSRWPQLPGTKSEIDAIAPPPPVTRLSLTGSNATTARLLEVLPKAGVAHFATHGEFNSEQLVAERTRELNQREQWQPGTGAADRLGGAVNPLGYVGLILSNGEQISGLSILDLDLSKLHLVTLSACETGLGELTGGEGVQGLQRAFHLAGCPNVVASLWKVSDAATAALMAKFYHEMWVNKQEPLAALRTAQLTIYRHPERIPALAGERGKPDQAKTVELKIEPRASASHGSNANINRTTPTKLWAAFVLSGVGK